MTVRTTADPGPDTGPSRAVSMLDLLDDGATGRGSVHFLGDEPDPTPMAELWRESERAARWIAANVGTGTCVAMVLTNTRSCVTALVGAWRAGCTVASLPLPGRGMSPQLYVDQLTRFCVAADAQTLMLDAVHTPLLADAPLRAHTFDEAQSGGAPCSFDGDSRAGAVHLGQRRIAEGHPPDHRRGRCASRRALAVVEPGVDDASCSWLPLSHDMGLIGQLMTALAAGAPRFGHHRLTLMKPETFMVNPRSWLRTCAQSGATITTAPNFALDLAIRTSARVGPLDLSRLRECIVGSEAVRADTLVRFADAFAPAGFRSLAFCPAYGMAEAALAVTFVRPAEPWRSIAHPTDHVAPTGAAQTLVSTGSPVDGVDVRVIAPDGEIGAIEFRSRSMLSRYLGAELHLTDDGYFATGDIGLLQRGELFVVGRSDEVIIVAGQNLYPDDIETAVHHEAIRAGCVAAVAAPDGGLAIVVEPSASSMSTTELEAACRKIRTMVARQTGLAPATVAFVARRSLPKTTSGKLRRVAISRSLAAGDGLLARVDFG